jgi:glycosyltransferase involved in cell wall biosynthesis
MKVLVVHNSYQQRGGEDAVVAAEIEQLIAHGDRVVRYERHNDELRTIGPLGLLRKGAETLWSSSSYRALQGLLEREKPDIAHFHNTFPLISPSAYYACADAGVPVVQSLHNYRLLCPAATFMRRGRVCESCLGRSVAWPGVLRACYRGSMAQTAALALTLAVHKARETWRTKVASYVALSEFSRRKFIEGGIPAERIRVKPNFVHPDPGPKTERGDYALFVGRLCEEKGLRVLLEAWTKLKHKIPLQIVGDGPLRDEIAKQVQRLGLRHISVMGDIPGELVASWMHRARFLVCPSQWYEAFPKTVAEAFACGLPVVCTRLGSLQEIVEDGYTGLHAEPRDAEDLAKKVEWAWRNEKPLEEMGRQARAEFERKYTGERNYRNLMRIYDQVLDSVDIVQTGGRASLWQTVS